MLRDRLHSASILIGSIVLLLFLDHRYPLMQVGAWWLLPALLFFAVGTALDAARLVAAAGRQIDRQYTVAAAAVIALSPYIPLLWPLFGRVYPADCPVGQAGWVVAASVFGMFIILCREMKRYDAGRRGVALERTFLGGFLSCYAGIPLAVLVMIRTLGEGSWGLAALISFVAVTKSADSGAYFTGRMFGRNKLIPRLSPGKTWEGLVGGVTAAIAVSFACFFLLIPAIAGVGSGPPWWGPIVFGFVCSIAGMIGDLAESLVKRETGAKDSGTTLPGLGGVWDVSDSMIAAAVPAWLCLAAGMAGSQ